MGKVRIGAFTIEKSKNGYILRKRDELFTHRGQSEFLIYETKKDAIMAAKRLTKIERAMHRLI